MTDSITDTIPESTWTTYTDSQRTDLLRFLVLQKSPERRLLMVNIDRNIRRCAIRPYSLRYRDILFRIILVTSHMDADGEPKPGDLEIGSIPLEIDGAVE
jgi:hypothetical protein